MLMANRKKNTMTPMPSYESFHDLGTLLGLAVRRVRRSGKLVCILAPIDPTAGLQINDHRGTKHISDTTGQIAVAEPKHIGDNPHHKAGPAFISQQIQRKKCKHHRCPVAALVLQRVFGKIFHRNQGVTFQRRRGEGKDDPGCSENNFIFNLFHLRIRGRGGYLRYR